MIKKINKNNNIKRGFTLVETLVAVAILTTAIAGPMTFAIKNISAASVAQDQLVAFELAQEPFEYVRNVRDTNLLSNIGGSNTDWLFGLDTKCTNGKTCYIDTIKDSVTECSVECPFLKISSNGYSYDAVSGKDTIFKRAIKIDTSQNGGDEAQITVEVSWTGKYGPRKITLQNNIYKWR